jgi:hypothetical protein
MMKTLAVLGVLLGVSVGVSRAQVDVEVVMDQGQFLPSEALPVAVRIINHSGQTLHFGSNDWLSYSIEAEDGLVMPKAGTLQIGHNFDLGTSKVATQRSDLAPFFDISRTGHYKVIATVQIADWGTEISSAPTGFDVIQGVKLWQQEFGLPESSLTNHEVPEVRKYILQKATYVKHLRLYLRITDPSESHTYRVLAIGQMTSFSQPATELDQRNNLHLLYENAARTYLYTVINPDGEILKRQMYYYTDAAPHLKTDDSGAIHIVGGMRHISPDDIPSSNPDSTTLNEPPPLSR